MTRTLQTDEFLTTFRQIIPESAGLLVTDERSRERRASATRVPKAVVLSEIDEAKLFELKEVIFS